MGEDQRIDQNDTASTENITSEVQPQESPVVSPQNDTVNPKKRFRHKKVMLLMLATALVFGGGSAVATYTLTNKDSKQSENNQTGLASVDQKAEAKDVLEEVGQVASGYTWLDVPKQVGKLALFKIPADKTEEDFEVQQINNMKYYQIGSGSDSSEVYVVAGAEELGGSPYLVVVKKGEKYSVLREHSDSYFYSITEGGDKSYYGPELLASVSVDPTSTIVDMVPPAEISYKGQKFSTTFPGSTTKPYLVFRDKLPEQTEFQTYQESGKITEGIVYENISKDDATYKVSRFELRIKPAFYLTMYLKGELSDQEIDPITWSDGSKNTVNYLSAGRGCGNGFSNEIAKYGKNQLVQIGKSDKGQIIYGFSSLTNELLLKHHSEYIDDSKNIDLWISGDESYYKKANFGLPIDQYVKLNPLYLVEDGMGRFLVFSRQDLVLVGGCAKPVIYAYPQLPTLLDVRVGADVTVSDPYYGNDGWNNVLAMPNGVLGYNGRQYDSLFWEGYGHGEYPEIKSGMVVEHRLAKETMQTHLAKLGLNDRETADFMEFWTPKIPDTKYVRLSWLGTHDMERLAPLYVSPAPDTRIRIFLDMEGLSEYVSIPEQVLSHVPRAGFTIVEWGGLVTDGSVPLLR